MFDCLLVRIRCRKSLCLCIQVAMVSVVALVISLFSRLLFCMGTSDSVRGASIQTLASSCNRFRLCLCLFFDQYRHVLERVIILPHRGQQFDYRLLEIENKKTEPLHKQASA